MAFDSTDALLPNTEAVIFPTDEPPSPDDAKIAPTPDWVALPTKLVSINVSLNPDAT